MYATFHYFSPSPFPFPLFPFFLFLGETGIGKSTLMDSLFKEDFKDTPVSHKQPDVKLSHNTYSEFTGVVYWNILDQHMHTFVILTQITEILFSIYKSVFYVYVW